MAGVRCAVCLSLRAGDTGHAPFERRGLGGSAPAQLKMRGCSQDMPGQAASPSGWTPAGVLGGWPHSGSVMDIERINQIGTTLADLTARTDALRGYL